MFDSAWVASWCLHQICTGVWLGHVTVLQYRGSWRQDHVINIAVHLYSDIPELTQCPLGNRTPGVRL